MRNWLVPVTLVGLSGLGLFLLSERGRAQARTFFDRVSRHGDPLGEFNKFLDDQVATIQRALDELSEALEEQSA